MDKILKETLKKSGIILLKSDNICIAEKIPLPGKMIGIIAEDGRNLYAKNRIEHRTEERV